MLSLFFFFFETAEFIYNHLVPNTRCNLADPTKTSKPECFPANKADRANKKQKQATTALNHPHPPTPRAPQVGGGIGPLGLVGPWTGYRVFKTNK